MPREITIAAVQMEADPAPLGVRLMRAERLVSAASQAGAQLVVLPELFNTGYSYQDANFTLAEDQDGPTLRWMRDTAHRLKVHLAGSLLLLDQSEIYNALLLFAPDGRMWRCDKQYPCGWERAYFHPARQGLQDAQVAHTDLGDIGMFICWDMAHLKLWRQYAGKVDLLLTVSCPPDISDPIFQFNGSQVVTFDQLGPWFKSVKGSGEQLFGEMFNQQAAWLGVPAVSTSGSGKLTTQIPNSRAGMMGLLPFAPWLVRRLPEASQMELVCDFIPACKIVDAQGSVLVSRSQEEGEGYVLAPVCLSESKPVPQQPQPPSLVPRLAYIMSDVVNPALSRSTYRKGLRRARGPQMAPLRLSNRTWFTLASLGIAAGFILGRLLMRRSTKRNL